MVAWQTLTDLFSKITEIGKIIPLAGNIGCDPAYSDLLLISILLDFPDQADKLLLLFRMIVQLLDDHLHAG
jgi:hypothetical protein